MKNLSICAAAAALAITMGACRCACATARQAQRISEHCPRSGYSDVFYGTIEPGSIESHEVLRDEMNYAVRAAMLYSQNNVDSMQTLKDAAAASIYGSRAANLSIAMGIAIALEGQTPGMNLAQPGAGLKVAVRSIGDSSPLVVVDGFPIDNLSIEN